ncbi:hypothetical protein QCA50_002716 [Cerrena zonata]|uniref:UBA domain-containing protein n=1 Tax=Cerrena zonata TaxID=2478898 RepID=A0AAW0GIM6_9APHY
MVEVGQQVETLKVDVEKAKKDGKQQKGLLAIAKKQLATKEADRARVLAELADAQAEVEATTKELEETEAELAKEDVPQPKVNGVQNLPPSSPDSITIAAAQPLPASPPEMPSPSGKSNNPFERLAMASGSPRSGSPFLPFADSAVLPTPPTASVQSDVNDDPFGFSDAFGAPEPAAAPAETDLFGSETFAESAQSATLAPPSEHPDVMSPADTDLFVTPPTSATIDKPSEEPASLDTILQSAAPSDASAEPFSVASPQVPGHFPLDDQAKATSEEHTDLNAQLKELDIEESDTDSDDDEPLANVQTKLAETSSHTTGQDVPSTSAFDDSFGITTSSTPKAESIRVASPIPPAVASVRSQSPALSSHSAPKDIFGSPFTPAPVEQLTPVQPAETPKPNGAAAGVSDFDEAFGKVSSSGPSSHFTFDSAFDDNFDFAAAREAVPTEPVQVAPPRNESLTATSSTFPPAPTGSTSAPKDDSFDAVFLSSSDVDTAPSSAAPAPSTAESKPFSFDDAFGAGPSQPTQLQPVQQSQSNGSIGISFDDAFGGHPSEALALDSLVKPTFQPPPGPPPGHVAQMAFPTVSPPATPHHEVTGNSSSEVRRSMSPPPRQRSPPPRHSSPKPRPSTASSDKEKPTRHSKLSIRLPFGRKKKQEPAPPMPAPISQQQVVEEPTPPAEDDMEAVKTLCGMGFSRTQAVTALERHGYDVQRALNSLLGSA